jgi:hypothetical protein
MLETSPLHSRFVSLSRILLNGIITSLVIARERSIKYRSTWISVIVGMAFASLASLYLRSRYIAENKRWDRMPVVDGGDIGLETRDLGGRRLDSVHKKLSPTGFRYRY